MHHIKLYKIQNKSVYHVEVKTYRLIEEKTLLFSTPDFYRDWCLVGMKNCAKSMALIKERSPAIEAQL